MHIAVDTLGHLLTLKVTPANEQDRAQVAELTEALQKATGQSVQLAYTKIDNVLRNNTSSNVMDLASLTNQGQPQDLGRCWPRSAATTRRRLPSASRPRGVLASL